MILTADSGSTKTTWVLTHSDNTSLHFSTQGINPFHMSEEEMHSILTTELLTSMDSARRYHFPAPSLIEEIHFFGAGCTREKSPVLKAILQQVFPFAAEIEVDSDMLGAAKALFGNEPGIACILGTGANSCLYDGEKIVFNISPMGYILGDEGSGAVLGKTFINLLYKGNHYSFISVFEGETGITQADIIQKVYSDPLPNRFLASLAPFIKKHISEPWIEQMVVECFDLFFEHNVKHYSRICGKLGLILDLPCSFIGSIAYYFEPQLRKAAKNNGSIIKKIMKEPL